VISQTIEYALRAVYSLANTPNGAQTAKQIAARMSVPPSYLAKVMQALARAGIVNSTRGLHGGFRLARRPAELSLLEVLNAVQPIQRIRTCPLDIDSHSTELCPLHRRLDRALAQMEEAFRTTTLADLLSENNPCPTLARRIDSADDADAADEPVSGNEGRKSGAGNDGGKSAAGTDGRKSDAGAASSSRHAS
jgi:Rrf2 family protein